MGLHEGDLMHDFPTALKSWRHTRRLSQLDLATEAMVSSRHLAFLETGRARPSRGMVLRLAGVLELPRADQNTLLTAAGFAPHYPALPLDATEMAYVQQAMDWTIGRHAPYPALVLDRVWRIVAMNEPAGRLFGAAGLGVGTSLLDGMIERGLLQALIENWVEVGYQTALRLRAESAKAGGIAELDRAVAALWAIPGIAGFQPQNSARAVLSTRYVTDQGVLSFFSTYAQFGGADEVALAEMKIELMFPADEATRAYLTATAG
jgi:transcriptional regulator with XRE-family HTH domain